MSNLTTGLGSFVLGLFCFVVGLIALDPTQAIYLIIAGIILMIFGIFMLSLHFYPEKTLNFARTIKLIK